MANVDKRNADLLHLHPVVRKRVEAVLKQLAAENIPFQVFEAYRSPDRQRHLFAQGRTRPGAIVTKAKPWQSYHQYGMAVDFVLFINGQWSWDDKGAKAAWWKRLHQVGREHGLEPLSWETPHLQLAKSSMKDLYAGRYPAGGDETWAENFEAAIISWNGSPSAPPVPAEIPERPSLDLTAVAADAADADDTIDLDGTPQMGKADWHNQFGGIEWRYDGGGVYVREHADGKEPLRTGGPPLTCRAIWQLCGEHIVAAARKHGVPLELIMMTIATETGFARKFGFTGPHTFRWEPHVKVADVSPPLMGDYSAGPMQTLATTARWIIKKQHLEYDPFLVAPVFKIRPAPPEKIPLYDLRVSIDIGTAVLNQRLSLTKDDPILVAATFNSGGVRKGAGNRWHLRSHGNHLDRAAEWYGDACAVLKDVRNSG